MRSIALFLTALLILTALLMAIAPVAATETDLRMIAIREKTIEDPNFEIRIKNAGDTDIDWNGARSNPRRVVVAAVLDSSEYGTAFVFAGSEKLVVVANNLGPQGDGIVIQDYQPPTTIGGPKIVETCHLLTGTVGGSVIPQEAADDALIGALTLVTMKQEVTQQEQDEAKLVLEQYRHIPRNPSVVPGSGENAIDWTLSPKGFKYNIYWSLTPGVTRETGTKIPDILPGDKPFIHTALGSGVPHYYVVTAVSKVTTPGPIVVETESVESPEVSGTPLP